MKNFRVDVLNGFVYIKRWSRVKTAVMSVTTVISIRPCTRSGRAIVSFCIQIVKMWVNRDLVYWNSLSLFLFVVLLLSLIGDPLSLFDHLVMSDVENVFVRNLIIIQLFSIISRLKLICVLRFQLFFWEWAQCSLWDFVVLLEMRHDLHVFVEFYGSAFWIIIEPDVFESLFHLFFGFGVQFLPIRELFLLICFGRNLNIRQFMVTFWLLKLAVFVDFCLK